jgi:hypothetical protein
LRALARELRAAVRAGRLAPRDHALLRARLLGRSLASAAEKEGIALEAARKRVARAERRLGRSFGLEKILKSMSPTPRLTAQVIGERRTMPLA